MIHVRPGEDATARERCLEAARQAVAERGAAYGAPAPFFAAVARRWSLELGVPVTAAQAVRCLLQLKLQRAAAGGGGDSFVDIAGYAACGAEIDEFFGDLTQEAAPQPFGRGPGLDAP